MLNLSQNIEKNVKNIIPGIAMVLVGRQAKYHGRTGASGYDRVVVKIEETFAVVRRCPAIAAIMGRLIVSAIGLYQNITVDKCLVVFGSIAYLDTVLAIDQVKIAIAALYPVITGDKPGRAVL